MVSLFQRHPDAAQVLVFALVITALWWIEHAAAHRFDRARLRHAGVNALFIVTALPAELVVSAACLAVSRWAGQHGVGLLSLLPPTTGPVLMLRYAIAFVLLDLCDYAYHRLAHDVPLFWRFHLVHHTDPIVDSSTTVREHPGETVFRGAFLVLWTLLLGVEYEALLLRQAAETTFAILSHSAVRLPPRAGRILGWLFVTPNLHHVHHHYELPFTNRNYGGVFSVWDRLFGTFAELPAGETIFGLDTHMPALAAVARPRTLFAIPFLK